MTKVIAEAGQCQPPWSEVLTANRGYVPIGSLDSAVDRLASWDKSGVRMTKGYEFELGAREYDGELLVVRAGGRETLVTPNHRMVARLGAPSQRWLVYLMRRGTEWRVGTSRLRLADRSAGPKRRLHREGGDAIWLLAAYNNEAEARLHEDRVSIEFAISKLVFTVPSGGRGVPSIYSQEQLDEHHGWVSLKANARGALLAHGLVEDEPFLTREAWAGSRGVMNLSAGSLLASAMLVPAWEGGSDFEWAEVESIERVPYVGPVFSINVVPHHTYVTDGVIVRNCMEGSVVRACAMAHAAHEAGAWGFKVQFLRPETIAAHGAAKYWNDDLGTADQADAFRSAGVIPYDAWGPLAETCADLGIEFLATPFDHEAVEACADYGMSYVKVASGDITNRPLLSHIADRLPGATILLSTGAATIVEVSAALHVFHKRNVVPLACTLAYPTPVSGAQLARLETLRQLSDTVGYSDHTSSPFVAFGAAALGAEYIEVHYTTEREGRVADQSMAVDPEQLADYVRAAEAGASARGSAYLGTSLIEMPALLGARRSIRTLRPIREGEVLDRTNIAILRPGGGLSPHAFDAVLGRKAHRAYSAGEAIELPQ